MHSSHEHVNNQTYHNVTPSTATLSPRDHNLNVNPHMRSPLGWSHVDPSIPSHAGYTHQHTTKQMHSEYQSSISDKFGYQVRS